ncbi:hypothetical protein KDAU_00250 [Dictyobacter aurantiacus]|uniref:Uncharacterized protein n=1 Tax=Dictyobacter aurantiacus TaxID=1936993 RepID=A0A401Z7A8_9CHLR|nr:hypothetical protein KDAU_00250 [Dictyobacter aurantiacus]
MGGVDGGVRARREQVSDDALEIGVELLGARQRHGLQAYPEGIGRSVVQAEQGALLCEREASVLTREVLSIQEKGANWPRLLQKREPIGHVCYRKGSQRNGEGGE